MTSGIRGMTVAVRNANDAISMTQVMEGALGQIGDILQRMRDLAVQSANATNSQSDRDALQVEFRQLQLEIERIGRDTQFNGINVLIGATGASLGFQVGANFQGVTTAATTAQGGVEYISGAASTVTASDRIAVDTVNIFNTASNYNAGSIAGASGATDAVTTINAVSAALEAVGRIDTALKAVNEIRANLGAVQSRFQATINNLQVSIENLSASRSRIRDADFAAETAALSRAQILQQAGTAMLAQANAAPQSVLSLLR